MNWPGLLLEVAPEAHPNVISAFESAETVFSDFNLSSPLRLAHPLAQFAHETGGFARLEENLNYSAMGLMRTWPSRFPPDVAARCACNPEMIANRAYQGRYGNKDPGDGWKYRGRGLIQITFRANYADMGKRCHLPLEVQPELVIASRYLLPVALTWWCSHGLLELSDRDDLKGITKVVNGGTNGLEDRRHWLDVWKRALA